MMVRISTAAGFVIVVAVVVAVVAGAAVPLAMADDWQYCLAPSRDDHKVYMSPPFPTRGRAGDADAAFGLLLDQKGYPHDNVQCPRADDANAIAAMRQHAININIGSGNAIVGLRLDRMR